MRRLQIALVGPPNVGKSSLFNALVKRFGCEHGPDQNSARSCFGLSASEEQLAIT